MESVIEEEDHELKRLCSRSQGGCLGQSWTRHIVQ